MEVVFYGNITKHTNGEKTFTPKNHSTLKALIDELSDYYGEDFESIINGTETNLLLVNNVGTALTGGLETPLNKGDKIEILPFVEAG